MTVLFILDNVGKCMSLAHSKDYVCYYLLEFCSNELGRKIFVFETKRLSLLVTNNLVLFLVTRQSDMT